jgi:hypothetical protein
MTEGRESNRMRETAGSASWQTIGTDAAYIDIAAPIVATSNCPGEHIP